MEDLSILVRDYGLKPQGKSAPMSSTKVSPGVGSSRGSAYGGDRKGSLSGRISGNASTFGGMNGSSKMSGRSTYGGDDIFSPGNYDDVFGGPPKSSTAGPRYDNVFGDAPETGRGPVFDDLLGGLGVNESKEKVSSPRVGSPRPDRSNFTASETEDLEELLPGFSSEPAKSMPSGDATVSRDGDPFVAPLIDDPFITTSNDSNSFTYIDPMDVFTVPPININTDAPHASSNASGAFDGFGLFDGYTNESSVAARKPREVSQASIDELTKSVEELNSNHSTGIRNPSPADEVEPSEMDAPTTVEPTEAYNISSKSSPYFSFKSDDGIETPAPSVSSSKHGDDGLFSSSLDSPVPFKARSTRSSPFADVKERWLTVNEVKLVTKPSSAPPPSRPPPVPSSGRYGSRSRIDHVESSGQEDRFTSSSWPSANIASAAFGNSSEEEQTGGGTPGGSRKDFIGRMDHRTNMANHSGDEKDVEDDAATAKAREKERQEKERQDRESKETEAREERARRYREKEREKEKDRAAVQKVTLEARERAAQEARDRAQRNAVERATAEARERAAQLAHDRAARERAAVEKANTEARERAEHRAAVERAAKERVAVERASAEARERAAAEARERADRLAVERAQADVRERAAERAAAERVAQESRQRAAERAAQEARQKAAAEARERTEKEARGHRRSEHDLDAFFNPGLHTNPPSSEPKRSSSVNNMSNMNLDPNGVRRSTNSNNSRPSSVPSGDYLRSLLEDPVPQPTSNSAEDPSWNKRSGASDRSRERAKQALETIRKREAEMQREQAEKHRAADQLDAEIKRWAAGKEGNLRALLSTLQYVLWPECGWQPVSLSDLITAGSVKKTYRKATLFVHPDKVQQKGATVQQKYIAEKVFDLLKEAWNKFNSEELF